VDQLAESVQVGGRSSLGAALPAVVSPFHLFVLFSCAVAGVQSRREAIMNITGMTEPPESIPPLSKLDARRIQLEKCVFAQCRGWGIMTSCWLWCVGRDGSCMYLPPCCSLNPAPGTGKSSK
jgi:hypothetical protein